MALPQIAFNVLKKLAPCRMLSLGMPDLLLTEELDVPERPNADWLRQLHQWKGRIYDTEAVFKLHSIKATYLDNRGWVGKELVGDLNEDINRQHGTVFENELCPWDHTLYEKFDVVLDPGTLEHCFNIAQAFVNVRNLCRPKGHIIHINPANIPNHGFYSISPTAYFDWYAWHGDHVLATALLAGDDVLKIENRMTFTCLKGGWSLVLVQRSPTVTKAHGWPTQWKYTAKDLRTEVERRAEGWLKK